MSHFAKVNKEGIVNTVIVAEEEFFDTYIDTEPGKWIQTSYNTYGGIHRLGGTPLRKNYAAQGYTYDEARDAFYEPQPHPSWILNETTCIWEAPIAYPDDDKVYIWDEPTTSWVEIEE
jgi:hypothetical protein